MIAAMTWLNPHVYLDTVVLLGSVSAQFPGRALAFAAGAMTASFTFFFGLGYGARLLAPIFARPRAWQVLDGESWQRQCGHSQSAWRLADLCNRCALLILVGHEHWRTFPHSSRSSAA